MFTLRSLLASCILSAGLLSQHLYAATERGETAKDAVIDLSGIWAFSLSAPEPEFPQATKAPDLSFGDSIELPGTTETRKKGPENTGADTGSLTRLHRFDGAAWYSRTFEIPESWAGQRVLLSLERTKYTQIWLDGQAVGTGTLYTAPQEFELFAKATPGTHRLLIMVDNRAERRPVHAEAHQFSDNTQTNWNGLLGKLELRRTPQVWIENLEIHPDLETRSFMLHMTLRNRTGVPTSFHLELSASSFNHEGPTQSTQAIQMDSRITGAWGSASLRLPLGPEALTWDEFHPALYSLKLKLSGEFGTHSIEEEAGLREFSTRDAQFTINGRTTFLRGKHDGCVFPLTGHPPMDLEGWMSYLRTCKEYGINHIRCHTWTPPKAAYQAADRLGIYFQPELPFWGTFTAAVRDFLKPEAEATLRAYGNHPCFVLYTLGNEIGGDRMLMNTLVSDLRRRDPRRLYADGSNNVLWDPRLQPTNDFWSSAKAINPASNEKQIPARGSYCVFDGNQGHVQWGPSETRTDLSTAIAGLPVPFVGHETGQWTSYPDYDEIAKYTGVTRARNLERFRTLMQNKGLLGLNKAFHRASTALAMDLYREENELFLRTPRMAGFQLLDLQDFPGQGTALVGVLDAFMDPKPGVTPELWKRSCDDLVLIARFDRYTWTNEESYRADLQLAHYGEKDLTGARLSWELRTEDGNRLAYKELPACDLQQGGLRSLCSIEVALKSVTKPTRFDLVATLNCPSENGRQVLNTWPVWVYPKAPAPDGPSVVRELHAWNEEAKAELRKGGRVLLTPTSDNWADTLPGAYATDYWNWPMFNNTPGTEGLLIEATHPALAAFPTKEHSERQWAQLGHHSSPVLLGALNQGAEDTGMIVRTIDNLERNEPLGLIFERKVGPGRLLVCAINFTKLQGKPEAAQLYASLLAYAASAAFAPTVEASIPELDCILRGNLAREGKIQASSFFQPPWGAIPSPERAIDGDINTRWIAAEADKAPSLSIDLGRAHSVDTLAIQWEQERAGYTWQAEYSCDGETWLPLCESSTADGTQTGRHTAHFVPVTASRIRLHLQAHPEGARFSLRQLRILGK